MSIFEIKRRKNGCLILTEKDMEVTEIAERTKKLVIDQKQGQAQGEKKQDTADASLEVKIIFEFPASITTKKEARRYLHELTEKTDEKSRKLTKKLRLAIAYLLRNEQIDSTPKPPQPIVEAEASQPSSHARSKTGEHLGGKTSAVKMIAAVPVGEDYAAKNEGDDAGDKQTDRAKPKKYKSRLILGDGNFGFSRAFLEKCETKGKKGVAFFTTVTEYDSKEKLMEIHDAKEEKHSYKNFKQNVAALQKMGAIVKFGIDATKIPHRFNRIHFNFPYVEATQEERGTLQGAVLSKAIQERTRKLVHDFFQSAAVTQQPGDRVLIALPKNPSDPAKEAWHQNVTYDPVNAAKAAGYVLITRRRFSGQGEDVRYSGYCHVKSGSRDSTETAECGREYVFKKIAPSEVIDFPTNKVKDGRNNREVLGCDTSDGTSSCAEEGDVDKKDIVPVCSKGKILSSSTADISLPFTSSIAVPTLFQIPKSGYGMYEGKESVRQQERLTVRAEKLYKLGLEYIDGIKACSEDAEEILKALIKGQIIEDDEWFAREGCRDKSKCLDSILEQLRKMDMIAKYNDLKSVADPVLQQSKEEAEKLYKLGLEYIDGIKACSEDAEEILKALIKGQIIDDDEWVAREGCSDGSMYLDNILGQLRKMGMIAKYNDLKSVADPVLQQSKEVFAKIDRKKSSSDSSDSEGDCSYTEDLLAASPSTA